MSLIYCRLSTFVLARLQNRGPGIDLIPLLLGLYLPGNLLELEECKVCIGVTLMTILEKCKKHALIGNNTLITIWKPTNLTTVTKSSTFVNRLATSAIFSSPLETITRQKANETHGRARYVPRFENPPSFSYTLWPVCAHETKSADSNVNDTSIAVLLLTS